MKREAVSGWGGTAARYCEVRHGAEVDLEIEVGRAGGRGICLRGEGSGYGDCATNGGGMIWRLADRGIHIDPVRQTAKVAAGVNLAELSVAAARHQLTVPVVPGTRKVTIGGMLAADVHGKNHHRDGSIFNHVAQVEILTGTGERLVLGPRDRRFWFLAGGMGAGAAILSATIKLKQRPSAYIEQHTWREADFAGVCERMLEADAREYSVAWVDLAHRRGRGVVTAGEWSNEGGWSEDGEKARVGVPDLGRVNFINPFSVTVFNQLWWVKSSHEAARVRATTFFHPLDGIRRWNRLYGEHGFIQYQFVVPEEGYGTLERIVYDLSSRRIGTPMVVLKRFGGGNRGAMSFPIAGWTLAVDIPARVENLGSILRRYDSLVAECGGRVYLAKDSCLGREHLLEMYPKIDRWLEVLEELDPRGVYQSDLLRRLGMVRA